MIPSKIEKYLQKYGMNQWSLVKADDTKYDVIIVVPVLDEYENVKKMLRSVSSNNRDLLLKTLIILVVNNVEDCSDTVRKNNFRTLQDLKHIIDRNKCGDEFIDSMIDSNLNIGFVDMSTHASEMDNKTGGVGAARKTGMDLALNTFDYESENKKIIICLDADCTVEDNYIPEIVSSFNNKNLMAAHVNYEHPLPEKMENKLAIICYEIFLKYYVLGLKYARSPYAIHTIGSTMICTDEAYISVQGMNRRKAAEDFYFMEKLAKLYDIETIDSTKVYPSGRGSWRVPFGTGQRVNRFLSKTRNEYELYSPHSFEVLRKWNEIYYGEESYTATEYLDTAKELNANLYNFLILNSFGSSWDKIYSNSKTSEQISKQKKMWFDGFRTLKLIHYLRDFEFPNEQMFDVLDFMFKLKQIDLPAYRKPGSVPELDEQIEYLNILRAHT